MPNTYFDSELTGAQIEAALKAIHGVITPENNGKVLATDNGKIVAKSASEWTDAPVLEPLSVTENGDYTPPTGTDGFDSVHVAVPSYPEPTGTIQITQNGTVNVKDYDSAEVNVSGGGGSAVIQPLSVTQNGTYNPPSGVDGYAPVTVNVSGGGGEVEPTLPAEYQEVEYIDFDGRSYVTISSRYLQRGDIFETAMQYITSNTEENAALGVDNKSNARFEFYFSGGKAFVYSASCTARGAIDNSLSIYQFTGNLSEKSISINDKVYAMLELYNFTSLRYLRIGATGSEYKYKNRLFKIKHSIVNYVLGNASQTSFFEMQKSAYTWLKPCYRKADNVPGWYDTTNNVFYTNEGAGTFVVGPDVN